MGAVIEKRRRRGTWKGDPLGRALRRPRRDGARRGDPGKESQGRGQPCRHVPRSGRFAPHSGGRPAQAHPEGGRVALRPEDGKKKKGNGRHACRLRSPRHSPKARDWDLLRRRWSRRLGHVCALEGWATDVGTLVEAANEGERLVHGNPSGIDVTVSAMGGVILFKRGEAPRRVDLPKPLSLLVVFSGKKRSTRRLITKVAALKGDFPASLREPVRERDPGLWALRGSPREGGRGLARRLDDL